MDDHTATVIANLEEKIEALSDLNDQLAKKLDEVFAALDEVFADFSNMAGVSHDLDSVISNLARIHGTSEGEWRA
jgi:hypothetical protein